MIMADQFRPDWMGCAGNGYAATPHIDEIARRGVRFPNAICNGPLCAPSRASIAAGVYPHRVGVLSNGENFPLDQTTYYQILRKHGYRVSAIGKTDLHKPDHFYGENGDLPVMYHLGFTDVCDTEGKMNASMRREVAHQSDTGFNAYGGDGRIPEDTLAGPYQRYLKSKGRLSDFSRDYSDRLFRKPAWYSGESVLPAEDFHDAFIGRKACEYLQHAGDESPWHLFVSFVGPHDPWDAPADYYARYQDTQFPAPPQDTLEGKPAWIKAKSQSCSSGMTGDDLTEVKRHYAGMITLIDDWIGRMLAILDARGLRENTAIIFCADHSEMLGEHGIFTKSCLYEGALRVPLVIACPDTEGGRVHEGLAENVDLYPTILDMAGIPYNPSGLDGESLLPALLGDEDIARKYQFSELHNTRMIFDGRYKAIESYNDTNELYDLDNDPGELRNILPENVSLARELFMKMRKLMR
jgi:arylsulfatase A-like enzyme